MGFPCHGLIFRADTADGTVQKRGERSTVNNPITFMAERAWIFFLEDFFMLPLQSSLGFLNGFTVCVLLQYRWGYLVDGALGESGPLLHFLWWHSQSEKFFSVFKIC